MSSSNPSLSPSPNWRLDVLVLGRPQVAMTVAKQLLEGLEQVPGAKLRKQGFPGLYPRALRRQAEGFKEGIWLPHALFVREVTPMSISSKGYFEDTIKEETFASSEAPPLEWLHPIVEHQDVLVHTIRRWNTAGLKHSPGAPVVSMSRFNPPSFTSRQMVQDYDKDDIRRHFCDVAVWEKEWKLSSNRESFLNHSIVSAYEPEQRAWVRSLELEERFAQSQTPTRAALRF